MDTIGRNLAASYGLTIVAGMPLPPALTEPVLRLQGAAEAAAPRQLHWYAPHHLHVTLAAPLRSRQRDWPPITRAELPADFAAFVEALAATCAALPPVELTLGPCRLYRETLSFEVEGGREHAERLRELLRCYGEFDLPKSPAPALHLSCGFLLPRFAEAATAERLEPLVGLAAGARASFQDVVLVHYGNRTLASVLGQARLPLGRVQTVTGDDVLQALHIRP